MGIVPKFKMTSKTLYCRWISTVSASIVGKIFINANENARIVKLEQSKLLRISTDRSGNYEYLTHSRDGHCKNASAIDGSGHSLGT